MIYKYIGDSLPLAHSSSPVRPPKLQLATEQPSTRECLSPLKKDTPYPRLKAKPQHDGQRGTIMSRIKLHICQRCSEGQTKSCMHQDPGKGAMRPTRD